MLITQVEIFKIVLAVLVGGAIGLERELHHKTAGFRTITLICMGATLITILDTSIGGAGRITANIVTGIGFLGAGVILHEDNRIKGLTTAAAVWLSAAVGIGIGSGAYLLSLATGGIILVVMGIFSRFESRLDQRFDRRHYEIVLPSDFSKVEQLEAQLRACGLHLGKAQRMKRAGQMFLTMDVAGNAAQQTCFVNQALLDPEIKEINW